MSQGEESGQKGGRKEKKTMTPQTQETQQTLRKEGISMQALPRVWVMENT